jgi:hypothetical protein
MLSVVHVWIVHTLNLFASTKISKGIRKMSIVKVKESVTRNEDIERNFNFHFIQYKFVIINKRICA